MIQPPQARRRRNPLTIPLAAAVVAILALAAGLTFTLATQGGGRAPAASATSATPSLTVTTPAPVKLTMNGTISLARFSTPKSSFDRPHWKKLPPDGCQGIGGYDDMGEGATVTVYDPAGEIVGASSLEAGAAGASACLFSFEVLELPDFAFYQVEVSHRGKVTVAKDRIGWVSLTLG